jgi:hypothetical protein
MLWFVVLTSLWCSQIAVARELLNAPTSTPHASFFVYVVPAWIALSWFSYRQRMFIILALQCVLPGTIGLVAAHNLTSQSSFSCFTEFALFANLVWFPAAAITMAVRWLWPATVKTRRDPRMPWWP